MQGRFSIINPNLINVLEQATTTPLTAAQARSTVQLNPAVSASLAGGFQAPIDFGNIGPIGPIFPFPRPIPVPTPQPTPVTPQPAQVTPSSVPTDLQLLLASLPFVQDGDLISSDYFNTIRSILFAVANQLGAGLTTSSLTTTIAPVFLGIDSSVSLPNNAAWAAWTTAEGYATAQQAGANAPALNVSGWFIVQLPNGAQISNMVIIGKRTSYPASTAGVMFQVQLVRQLLADPTISNNIATLITMDLTGADGTFTSQPASIQAPAVLGIGSQGSVAVALQHELQTVDTAKYRYLLVARASSPANATSTASIFAVQINYTR